jgi:exonuclease III
LYEWTPISGRIITARFWSKYIKTTIIKVYAPNNDTGDGDKEVFYEQLQKAVNETPKHDTMLIIGEPNAKVGKHTWKERMVL